MVIRLGSVSTSKNTTAILHQVVTQFRGAIELALHLGDQDADIKASALSRMDLRAGRHPHVMRELRFRGGALELIQRPDFHQELITFIDHLYRKDSRYAYRSHHLSSIHDYIDYYFILYDVLLARIEAAEVSYFLFFDLPHQAYDTIVWHIAHALGIPCLILNQASQFPGKFFSMRTPEAYGVFKSTPGAVLPFPINSKAGQSPFYMKGVQQGEGGAKGGLNTRALAHAFLFVVLKKPSSLFRPAYIGRLLMSIRKIGKQFPDWRDPFARYFHESELAYFEHLAQYEKNPVDYNDTFVYFPLHLQPEMTTSALGGEFRDQALAIEVLARMLPQHLKIYVKENPKQRSYMRGPLFFHRLKRIPNVRILPSHADTHLLLERCQWVATITGTAGWEAICNRKKVLVFGRPWYQMLPGVIRYQHDLSYQDIEHCVFTQEALSTAVAQLLTRAHSGVIERHYQSQVPEFDEQENCRRVAHDIASLLLEKMPVTFENV